MNFPVMFFLSFLRHYWKGIILFSLGLALGLSLMHKIDKWRYSSLERKYSDCKQRLDVCVGANKENEVTITKLKEEVSEQVKSCNKRISYYKKLLKKFQEIDNLGGGFSGNETSSCGDVICDELRRMFSD